MQGRRESRHWLCRGDRGRRSAQRDRGRGAWMTPPVEASGLGGLLLARVLLLLAAVGRAAVALLAAVLPPRAAAAVVRRVEPGALEVDGHGMQHDLERALAADRALLGGRRRDRLEDLEQVAFGAAVLVRRHQNSLLAPSA